MPTVDQNRLKGNYAAAHVAARLSAECLVRPVATDTDVGVDLYCETLEDTHPFLHFWVQVKAGQQCRVSSDGGSASCYFDAAHLEYWRRQPVPVYAALVPVEWPVTQDPDVFMVDVTGSLLQDQEGATPSGRALTSQYVWRAGERAPVRRFLAEYVPASTARLQCRHGVVSALRSLSPRYVQVVPIAPVARFSETILMQVRHTAAFAILALKNDGLLSLHSGFRRRLALVAAQFSDDDHWETYAAQAYSCHADREFPRAVELYNKAIAIIHADPHVRDLPDWTHLATELGVSRQRAEFGQDL